MKKALLYYRSIWGWMIFCAIIGLSRIAISVLEPQVVSLMVDCVIKPALGGEPADNSSIFSFLIRDIPADHIWQIMAVLSITFFVLLIIYFITFYARWNIIHYVSLKIENRMRAEALHKINQFGPAILKDYTNGELITIVNRDASMVREIYVATIPFILDNVFCIGMSVFFLSRTNLRLLICPLLTFILYGFITRGFVKKSDAYYNKMWKQNSALNTEAQESVYGIRTIKAYAAEPYRFARFSRKSEELRDFYVEFGRTRYRYFLLYDGMDQILMAVTMAVSIYLASRFLMTDGEYSAFLGYMLLMTDSFVSILFLIGDFQESKVSCKRMFELLEMCDPMDGKFGEKKVSSKPHITLEHVSVMSDEQELLCDISVDIPYGKKLGIMGKTGSGKSVFLKTMQGFTDYCSGQITIDGQDFHTYDRGEIAKAYSYAMQDVFLFSNSIASNIELYQPEGNLDKIQECGRLAEVDEFVKEFPDGYMTLIGEKGFGLSGGQKQRVAIARALYKDAPVIVLDDCTNALDVETEQKIFTNLKEVGKQKTMIIATHRAQAIADCDEILFFEDGRIIERGSFGELMTKNGRYAAVYRKQCVGAER